MGEDCPVFDGMFEFCSIFAGASIGKSPAGQWDEMADGSQGAAQVLNSGESDIAVK